MDTYYAEVSNEGAVKNVIVADPNFLKFNSGGKQYVETFLDADGDPAKRYNYAIIDGKYLSDVDAFIEPQPYKSWVLDAKYKWQAPVAMPADGSSYVWEEATASWKNLSIKPEGV